MMPQRVYVTDQALSIIGSLASLLCPSTSKFFIFEDIRPLLSTYVEVCNINESLLTAEMTVGVCGTELGHEATW